MRAISVAIADDDDDVRETLAQVLDADRRFTVTGAVADAESLLRLVTESGPDLVILDVRMPGGGAEGAAAVRDLCDTIGSPPPAVVALTAQTDAGTVVGLLRAGAVGYLVKGHVGSDLPDLLARVARGEVVLAVPTGAEALKIVLTDPS